MQPLIYNIDTFDGGITDRVRDLTDLSKCAHISHFDIYRESNVMYPMPGYISDTLAEPSSKKAPGTADSSTGEVAWSNPSNIKTDDGTYATVDVSSGAATVVSEVRLLLNNTPLDHGWISDTVSNKATYSSPPAEDTIISYGSPNDLWGADQTEGGITPAKVNASGFGVCIKITGGYTSEFLMASNFDFGVSSEATITGFVAHIEQKLSGTTVSVRHITLEVYFSSGDGIKSHKIRSFFYDGTLWAVGKKADGTGSKLFEKASPTDSAWVATAGGEGADTVFDNTFLVRTESTLWFVTQAGGNTYLSSHTIGSTTDKVKTVHTGTILESVNDFLIAEQAIDGNYYTNTGRENLMQLDGASATITAAASTYRVTDAEIGDAQLVYVGYKQFPHSGILTIWDLTLNPNETLYHYNLGPGIPRAIGKIGPLYGVVIDEGISLGPQAQLAETTNGTYAMNVALAGSASVESHTRVYASVNTNGKIMPSRGKHKDAMLWYARLAENAQPSSYKEGIWAFGLNRRGLPALSLLLDTESLGSVERHYQFGNHHFFAHNNDGSISRLGPPDAERYRTGVDNGAYNVTSVYESLLFGATTPNEKQLTGITVITSPLPDGGALTLKYRTMLGGGWQTMGSVVTVGKQTHSFTKAEGRPIGNFQEIQFRLEVTGNCPVRNIEIELEQLPSFPY